MSVDGEWSGSIPELMVAFWDPTLDLAKKSQLYDLIHIFIHIFLIKAYIYILKHIFKMFHDVFGAADGHHDVGHAMLVGAAFSGVGIT